MAVPSRVSLLISILTLNLVLIYKIPPELRGGVHLFIKNRHTPSGQFRVYQVTQLRTDGVHSRESAGTGPVNLKVFRTSAALAGHHVRVCVCVVIPFVLDVRLVDVSDGVTQEEAHTGILHLPSPVLALIFSREGFSHSLPSSTVKSNFMY